MTEDVGNGVDLVLVLDQRAQPQGAGPLALDALLDAAVGGLVVLDLRRVARDVDERRIELDQIVDQRQQVPDVLAAQRRNDLETDQRPLGAVQVLGDSHGKEG